MANRRNFFVSINFVKFITNLLFVGPSLLEFKRQPVTKYGKPFFVVEKPKKNKELMNGWMTE